MEKVLKGFGTIMLAIFGAAIVVFMGIMNYNTLGRVFPDDPMQQLWGMALFTGGTISWFIVFLYASRGFQRPIALFMFFVSLLGEVMYSAADVLMGGQAWVTVSPQLGNYVIYTFVGLTFAHGLALYLHKIAEPATQALIDREVQEDEILKKAKDRAQELVNQRVEGMADQLATRDLTSVFVSLRLPVPQVIDAVAQDVDFNNFGPAQAATATAQKEGWFDRLFRLWPQPQTPATNGLSDADVERLAQAWQKLQLEHTAPSPTPAPGYKYTLGAFLEALGMDADSARAQLRKYGLDQDANKAFDALTTYGLMPSDLIRENFQQLHGELFLSTASFVPGELVEVAAPTDPKGAGAPSAVSMTTAPTSPAVATASDSTNPTL